MICAAQLPVPRAEFVRFKDFVQGLKQASSREYLARRDSRIRDAAAFEEMRRYLLSMYGRTHVVHSYVLGSQVIDCIPIHQQPAVAPLASPQQDEFGNSIGCGERTIPMRRITLEQLSKFPTLRAFLQKGPDGGGGAPSPSKRPPQEPSTRQE